MTNSEIALKLAMQELGITTESQAQNAMYLIQALTGICFGYHFAWRPASQSISAQIDDSTEG